MWATESKKSPIWYIYDKEWIIKGGFKITKGIFLSMDIYLYLIRILILCLFAFSFQSYIIKNKPKKTKVV